jgi:hypothetical protein
VKHRILRIAICIFPLALTPLLAHLISDGYLNFGGGEKDLLLLIPWLIWSVIFLAVFIVTWIKKVSIITGILYSGAISTFALLLIWLILFILSSAGLSGY